MIRIGTRALALTIALAPAPALAHPLAPAHLRIDLGPLSSDVTLTHARDAEPPRIVAPPQCAIDPPTITHTETALVLRSSWRCTLAGPLVLTASTASPPLIVEVRDLTAGTAAIAVLDAAHPVLALGAPAATPFDTLGTWLTLGVAHLIGGLDHLLLVLGLVLLIGLRWRLLAALTAFTVGHSLSLALGGTGAVTLPTALVEVSIALTLIALALDLAGYPFPPHTPSRAPAPTRASLFARAPWLTGLAVGLVHGLGFAGALADLGLPRDDTALALLGFNLGLEVAQLALVAVCAVIGVIAIRIGGPSKLGPYIGSAAAWVIGIAGAHWLIERIVGA